jgi:hypothetical protein
MSPLKLERKLTSSSIGREGSTPDGEDGLPAVAFCGSPMLVTCLHHVRRAAHAERTRTHSDGSLTRTHNRFAGDKTPVFAD